jgi:hypothetical protein
MTQQDSPLNRLRCSLLHPEDRHVAVLPPDAASQTTSCIVDYVVTLSDVAFTLGFAEAIVWLTHESFPFVKRVVAAVQGQTGTFLYPLYTGTIPTYWVSGTAPPTSVGGPSSNLFFSFIQDYTMIPVDTPRQPNISPSIDTPGLVDSKSRCIQGHLQVFSESTDTKKQFLGGTVSAFGVQSLTGLLGFTPATLTQLVTRKKALLSSVPLACGILARLGMPSSQLKTSGHWTSRIPNAAGIIDNIHSADRVQTSASSFFAMSPSSTAGKTIWMSPFLQIRSNTPTGIVEKQMLRHPSLWTQPTFVVTVVTQNTSPGVPATLVAGVVPFHFHLYHMFMVQGGGGLGQPTTYTAYEEKTIHATTGNSTCSFMSIVAIARMQPPTGTAIGIPVEAVWVGTLVHLHTDTLPSAASGWVNNLDNRLTVTPVYDVDRPFSEDATIFHILPLGADQGLQITGKLSFQTAVSPSLRPFFTPTDLEEIDVSDVQAIASKFSSNRHDATPTIEYLNMGSVRPTNEGVFAPKRHRREE